MNVTSEAIVIAPDATRNPPTPSTTRSETCSAMPATGPPAPRPSRSARRRVYASVASVETDGDLALRRPRGAHRADRADRALDTRGELADLDLLLGRRRADPAAEQHHDHDRDADHDDDQGEQDRVDDRHGHQRADEDERVADGIRQALRQHRVEQRRVGADARDEVAGAACVELADRQVQDARDELAAARVDDRRAGALQQVVLVARDERRDHDEARSAATPASRASRRPARASMTWPTSSGWARVATAPSTLRTATTTSTRLCSKMNGSSWPNVARGPSGTFRPRPRRRPAVGASGASIGSAVSERVVCGHGCHLWFVGGHLRPYFLWTACRLTPRAAAMACQE